MRDANLVGFIWLLLNEQMCPGGKLIHRGMKARPICMARKDLEESSLVLMKTRHKANSFYIWFS